MIEEVPEGWAVASVERVCSRVVVGFVGPTTEHYSPQGVPFLTGKNVRAGGLALDNFDRVTRTFHQREVKSQLLAGDVIVVRIGRSGEAAVVPKSLGDANCGGLVIAKQPLAVIPEYLAWYFNSVPGQSQLLEEVRGVTRQTLNTKSIARALVPVAPFAEQRRIVETIESLLSQVNAARDCLAKVHLISKRLRRSVLAAACSGKLTEDWRQRAIQNEVMAVESSPPDSWSRATLGELASLVTSGSRGWAQHYSEEGPLFIRAQDINTDALVLDEVAHVRPPRGAEGLRTRVAPGDLLVTITGANVTRTAWVDRSVGEAYVSQHVGLVRPSDPGVTPFLHAWLCSPAHGRAALLEAAYGAGKPGLKLENLRSLEVVMPPVEERTLILKRMLELLALADTIERRIAVASARADVLTQSILAKVFRGELVPTEADVARAEGREYESAGALLARVQSERAATVPTTGGRRRVARRAGAGA